MKSKPLAEGLFYALDVFLQAALQTRVRNGTPAGAGFMTVIVFVPGDLFIARGSSQPELT